MQTRCAPIVATDMDDNEAIWRMNEFAKAIYFIEDNLAGIKELIANIENSPLSPTHQWDVLHAYSHALNITIRKKPERVTSYDELTMKEIWSRARFRSCHDALCLKPHCSECGRCGARFEDGHTCDPPDLPE